MDVTGNYKYMYFCCGSVVILASIWLFIGNFINYRLLDKERKKAEMYKQAEMEDPDQDARETDENAHTSEPSADKQEGAMQRETNI